MHSIYADDEFEASIGKKILKLGKINNVIKLVYSTEDPNISSITTLNEAHIIGDRAFEFTNLISSDSEGPSSLDVFSKPY